MRNDWDDDRLLAALGQALKAREAVPSWFIEAGKNAFAWHNIDAELGIPVGSIGPQRARCLERMRRSSALAALGEGEEKIDIRGGEPGA